MKMQRKGKKKSEDGMQTPPDLYAQLSSIFTFDYDAACTSVNCLCVGGGNVR